jgi:hypothetical protein
VEQELLTLPEPELNGGDEHVGGEEKFDDTKRLIRNHK